MGNHNYGKEHSPEFARDLERGRKALEPLLKGGRKENSLFNHRGKVKKDFTPGEGRDGVEGGDEEDRKGMNGLAGGYLTAHPERGLISLKKGCPEREVARKRQTKPKNKGEKKEPSQSFLGRGVQKEREKKKKKKKKKKKNQNQKTKKNTQRQDSHPQKEKTEHGSPHSPHPGKNKTTSTHPSPPHKTRTNEEKESSNRGKKPGYS